MTTTTDKLDSLAHSDRWLRTKVTGLALLTAGAAITYLTHHTASYMALPAAIGICFAMIMGKVICGDETRMHWQGYAVLTMIGWFFGFLALTLITPFAPPTEITQRQYGDIAASMSDNPTGTDTKDRARYLAEARRDGYIDQREYHAYFARVDAEVVDKVLGTD